MTRTQASEAFSRLFAQARQEPDSYDPFADFAILREQSPVFHDSQASTWHVFSYADVVAGLRLEMTTKTARMAFSQHDLPHESILWRYFENIIFTTDTQRHRAQHDIFKRTLVPRFGGMYPRIKRITNAVFTAALGSGNPLEIVSHFSTLIPLTVIADWMGIELSSYDQLRIWTEAANAVLDPGRTQEQLAKAIRAMEDFFAFFFFAFFREHIEGEHIEERYRRGGADLLTDLAREMQEDKFLSNCVTLGIAAHESVANTISQGIIKFVRRPDLLTLLREHPAYLNDLTSALLRKNASTSVASRQLTQPFACANGVVIPAGAVVALWLASANRDPEVFDHPDERHLGEAVNHRHLAFSQEADTNVSVLRSPE